MLAECCRVRNALVLSPGASNSRVSHNFWEFVFRYELSQREIASVEKLEIQLAVLLTVDRLHRRSNEPRECLLRVGKHRIGQPVLLLSHESFQVLAPIVVGCN